jgi:ABC-type oligopeptide transport system substrate-binding subunit
MMGLLHSEHGVLGRLSGNANLDHLLEQGRRETDPALRHAIYRELEDHIAREALLVPLFHEQTYRIAHPRTRGLRLGLSLPEVRYEELWIAP